jgi:response regulator RpfG family c-di-GMP phosphodiesterase
MVDVIPRRPDRIGDALDERGDHGLERVLGEVCRELGMDAAYVSEFSDGRQVYRVIAGDSGSFGHVRDDGPPLTGTYCRRMVAGEIDNLITDAKNDPAVKDLPITSQGDIGSYIGVPIKLSTGEVYGTVCVLSHQAHPELRDRDVRFLTLVARIAGDEIERRELEHQNWVLEVRSTGVSALGAALDERDGYTGAHSLEVVNLAVDVALRLGLSGQELADVEQIAFLHDIGKIGIPDDILHKPGRLGSDEWAIMKTHTIIGERIVSSIEGLAHLAPAIRGEHERWDGFGYPDRLKGDQIPLPSRIVLACDAYHAMTSDRPYRGAMTPQAAREELWLHAGTQFDPAVVEALSASLSGDA